MERQKMKKKGFTLVELLVVIAIIAMLLAILMPALGKVRQLAQRIMCSTNLVGIGKAMMTYSTDDKYESFPKAGSQGAYWDCGSATEGECTWQWYNPKFTETGTTPLAATLSSNLYLLVKFADVAPEQFVCPGSDQKKFEVSKYPITGYTTNSFTDVWDFGSRLNDVPDKSRGKGHNSYSYQLPMQRKGATAGSGVTSVPTNTYSITTTSNPSRPIMADRNPFWMDNSSAKIYDFDCTTPTGGSAPASKPKPDSIPNGNNTYHQKDGQGVLYADLHSKFEKQANVGIQSDNIYTTWGQLTIDPSLCGTDEAARQCGRGGFVGSFATGAQIRAATTYYPTNEEDSYLVSDLDKADN